MDEAAFEDDMPLFADDQPSFCCCEATPPPICCLYPYPGPEGIPLYPDTDLPDTIVLTVGEPPGVSGLVMTRSGYKYEETDGLGFMWEVTAIDSFGAWIIRVKEEEIGPWENKHSSFCLIFPDDGSGAFVEDEFSDTYDISYNFERPDGRTGTGSGTLARAGLCQWTGDITETYDDPLYDPEFRTNVLAWSSPTEPYKWCIGRDTDLSPDDLSIKDDPQSSPAGTYADSGTPGTTTEYTACVVS